jgi:aminoglycoside 3'-phosphotransferase-2
VSHRGGDVEIEANGVRALTFVVGDPTQRGELSTAALFEALSEVRGYRLERMSIGRSQSSVYRLHKLGTRTLFLKVSTLGDAAELAAECDCLGWLASRTSVPTVLKFVTNDEAAFLLTVGLAGNNAAEAPRHFWSPITEQLALQLRQLHSLDPAECPFDRTLDRVIPLAAKRAAAGQLDESDFDSERASRSASDLVDSLYRERPQSEDIVIVHGDACLPNAIFDQDKFSGFVDCGRCGRADRYKDLALAYRSIKSNFGRSLAENFLAAYGLDDVDPRKLSYYQLLDEFF